MPDIFLRIMTEIVTFGVGFSLVFAIAQVSRKDPDLSSCLYFLVWLGNSIVQLLVVLVARSVIPEHPFACFLSLSAIFFIGPANYLYHYILLNPERRVPVRVKVQFAPAAAALLCEAVFQLLPLDVKRAFLAGLFTSPLQSPFTLVVAAGAGFNLVYFLNMLRLGFMVVKSERIRTQVIILLAAFLFTLVAVSLLFLGFLLVSAPTMLLGGAIITLINVAVFLSNMRYPDFYRIIESEIQKKRYERSLIKGLDTELILERLASLMKVEHAYKDFDLSLEGLAQMLSITPHQLSQLMNERLSTNFRTYVNTYRIEEAKKILAGDADKNILTICYDVGFNSKSTFNHWFKTCTGKTPSEYRQGYPAGDMDGTES